MIDSTINNTNCCNSIEFKDRYYFIGDRKIKDIEHSQEHKSNLIQCRILNDRVDDSSGCKIKEFFNDGFDNLKNDFDFIEIFTIDENNTMYILFQNYTHLAMLKKLLKKYENTTISIMYVGKYGVNIIQNLRSIYKNLSVNIYDVNVDKELTKQN